MADPRVSVLLCVRDGEPYLAEALESLRRQSFADFEVIAVDDGSRDGSGARLDRTAHEDARFRVVHHDAARGLTASLNEAAGLARGALWARQDADDRSRPERLAAQAAAFDADPDLVLLGSAYQRIDAEGRALGIVAPPAGDTAIRWTQLFHNAFCHSAVMLRAAALEPGRPPYDPHLPVAQDYDCWSRLLARGRGANLRRALVELREHPRQITAQRLAEQQRCADAIAARAMRALVPEIDLEEVPRLRAIQNDRTVVPTPEEKRTLRRLLERLSCESGSDARALRRIRWRLEISFALRPLRRLPGRPASGRSFGR